MLSPIKINVKPKDIIAAVKRMKKSERDAFLEDLLAAKSSSESEKPCSDIPRSL